MSNAASRNPRMFLCQPEEAGRTFLWSLQDARFYCTVCGWVPLAQADVQAAPEAQP